MMFYYEGALIITFAISLVINIFLAGLLSRWIKKAHYWEDRYQDSVSPINPPVIECDPYEGVKTALEYNWKEEWD